MLTLILKIRGLNNVIMTKDERQNIAVEKWKRHGAIGGWQFPTGFGKTYTARFKVIMPSIKANPHISILVIVHSSAMEKDWKLKVNELEQVDVRILNSIYIQDTVLEYDLVVIDEPSSMYGPNFKRVWNGELVHFRWLLWLDATPKEGSYKEFLKTYPIVDIVTTEEAELNGWVSKYKIINIGVDLTEEEMEIYTEITGTMSEEASYFNNDFNLIYNISKDTELAKQMSHEHGYDPALHNELSDPNISEAKAHKIQYILANYSPTRILERVYYILELSRQRMKLLYEAEQKIEVIEDILLNRYPNRKTICFSQSTTFATKAYEALKDKVNAAMIHSKVESRPLRADPAGRPSWVGQGDFLRYKSGSRAGQPKIMGKTILTRTAFREFADGTIRVLFTGKGLDKGIDYNDISLAIISSQSSSKGQFIQRKGRTTRLGEKKFPIVIVIYCKNTTEHNKILRIQEDINAQVVWEDWGTIEDDIEIW